MKTLRDFLDEAEADEGGRRQPARPDDGVLQQQPGQRQQPLASRTCRSCSPAAASSTASTWPSTRRTRRRCATSTSACSSGWASRPTSSAPARARCTGWRRSADGGGFSERRSGSRSGLLSPSRPLHRRFAHEYIVALQRQLERVGDARHVVAPAGPPDDVEGAVRPEVRFRRCRSPP